MCVCLWALGGFRFGESPPLLFRGVVVGLACVRVPTQTLLLQSVFFFVGGGGGGGGKFFFVLTKFVITHQKI